MYGAIIGDIVGSVFEWNNKKTVDFRLFTPRSHFTDDTVMTAAVAEGLMNGGGEEKATEEAIKDSMLKYGAMFPRAGYGGGFSRWLNSKNPKPYNSFGNGSAMRVSPVGWFAQNIEDTEQYAEISARITHNHPEGIKGAVSVAGAIFLAREGKSKDEIKEYVTSKFHYDLDRTLDEIRPSYKFDVTCQGSVPEAIIAFLESDGFEDAIRKAVSLGGDSDTIGAITGSIAEAAYGIPDDLKKIAESRLDGRLLRVIDRWEEFLNEAHRSSRDTDC